MPRERFLDPNGKPFEIETDLLASHGNALQRFHERSLPRSFARIHASTRSSRYGELAGGVTYKQDFEHNAEQWHRCGHGQEQTLCHGCGEWLCSCPGQPKHECRSAA